MAAAWQASPRESGLVDSGDRGPAGGLPAPAQGGRTLGAHGRGLPWKGFKANAKACFKRALELDPSVAIPADVNPKEPDVDASEATGLFGRFKAMLGGGKDRA